MSRLSVSNPTQLDHIVVLGSTNGTVMGHRALIVVEGVSPQWLEHYASSRHFPFIAAKEQADRSDRVSALLGQEYDLLAHTPAQPLDVGLFAALAGTIKAGGVLILGIEEELPPAHPAPGDTLQSVLPPAHHDDVLSADRLNRRLSQLLQQCAKDHPDTVFRVSKGKEFSQPPMRAATAPVIQPLLQPHHAHLAQQEQDQCLESAMHYLRQHARGCITLVGKRGRGKSTLLARIANGLNSDGIAYDIATLKESSLHSFRRGLDHTAPRWMPADQQSDASKQRVLLVDEAGNLPLGLLMTFLKQRQQLVFCTTVEGYESAGRAFDVRLLAELETHFPQPLHLKPSLPWRWSAGDPLEELIGRLTLSDACSPVIRLNKDALTLAASGNLHTLMSVRRISQAELIDNESLLEAVYGLLRDTHYQTTVTDLQHLLEGRDTELWVGQLPATATLGGDGHSAPVAVLLMSIEGSIAPELHDGIRARQRRLPHHLLPQLLAQMSDSIQPLSCRYGRVVRISVVASLRRHGLARALLHAVEAKLVHTAPSPDETPDPDPDPDPPLHALGASFASDPVSLAFWQANGYREFHRGFRQNPRTGARAVAVIKSSHTPLRSSIETAIAIHRDNQRWLTDSDSRPITVPQTGESTEQDDVVLTAFAKGRRSANDSYGALARLEQRALISLERSSHHSQRAHERHLRARVTELLDL